MTKRNRIVRAIVWLVTAVAAGYVATRLFGTCC